MISIEMLRSQHDGLVEQVDSIVKFINENKNAFNEEMLRELLTNLSAELELHLLIEDDLLYPALMKDSTASIRNVAHVLSNELGGFKETFKRYKAKWIGQETMVESLEAFISETETMATLLRKKIDKENKQLFPLLENRHYRISSLHLA